METNPLWGNLIPIERNGVTLAKFHQLMGLGWKGKHELKKSELPSQFLDFLNSDY